MAVFKRGLELCPSPRPGTPEIWFSAKEPGYAGVARQALGKVSYAMPSTVFAFVQRSWPSSSHAKSFGFKLACQQCEREEADLDWLTFR